MKIRPVGAELFHADGRIDMTKLIVTFRNFPNPPKNDSYLTERTLRFCYTHQPINTAWRNNCSSLIDPYETHKYNMRTTTWREVPVLLRCDASSMGNWFPALLDSVVV